MTGQRMMEALVTARVPKKESGLTWRLNVYRRFHADSTFRKPRNEGDAEALKQKVREMHPFYFKGMAAIVTHLFHSAESYPDYLGVGTGRIHPRKAEKARKEALHALEFIKEKYAEIPFEKLGADEDYYPLFAARSTLALLEKETLGILSEKNPEKADARLQKIYGLSHLFRAWGAAYKGKVNAVFKRIHEIEKNDGFGLDLMSILEGTVWKNKPYL